MIRAATCTDGAAVNSITLVTSSLMFFNDKMTYGRIMSAKDDESAKDDGSAKELDEPLPFSPRSSLPPKDANLLLIGVSGAVLHLPEEDEVPGISQKLMFLWQAGPEFDRLFPATAATEAAAAAAAVVAAANAVVLEGQKAPSSSTLMPSVVHFKAMPGARSSTGQAKSLSPPSSGSSTRRKATPQTIHVQAKSLSPPSRPGTVTARPKTKKKVMTKKETAEAQRRELQNRKKEKEALVVAARREGEEAAAAVELQRLKEEEIVGMMEVEAVMINLLQELAQEEAKRAEEEARYPLWVLASRPDTRHKKF
jgi:hypothetical protein